MIVFVKSYDILFANHMDHVTFTDVLCICARLFYPQTSLDVEPLVIGYRIFCFVVSRTIKDGPTKLFGACKDGFGYLETVTTETKLQCGFARIVLFDFQRVGIVVVVECPCAHATIGIDLTIFCIGYFGITVGYFGPLHFYIYPNNVYSVL